MISSLEKSPLEDFMVKLCVFAFKNRKRMNQPSVNVRSFLFQSFSVQ